MLRNGSFGPLVENCPIRTLQSGAPHLRLRSGRQQPVAAHTVLIVDNQPDIRRLLRLLLEQAGSVVLEATTGAEGIEQAFLGNPDAVILDWEMPEMTGIGALPMIRNTLPRAQIMMFSARSSSEAAPLALTAGADGYFEKPDFDALVAAVTNPRAGDTLLDTPRSTAQGPLGTDDTIVDIRDAPARPHLRIAPMSGSRCVLVVDDDRTARRLLRLALELTGATVIEASSLAEADAALDARLGGVILDRRLPDGDGLDLLASIRRKAPGARVVVCSNVDDHREPSWVLHVSKTNMDGVVVALGLGTEPSAFATVFDASPQELVGIWQARCHRGGLSNVSTLAEGVIDAVATASPRADADSAARDLLTAHLAALVPHGVPVELALEQLHCLRDVLLSHIATWALATSHLDVVFRINHLIDHLSIEFVTREAEQLRHEALVDPLTGLGNRRAFDAGLAAESNRALRYRHPFSVVMVDLDGLKRINDSSGHAAGDAALVAMADAVRAALRETDAGYRVGGDEFVMLLPETPKRHVPHTVDRLYTAGAPPFSWGAATYGDDTDDRSELVELADQHLLERRRAARN